MQSLEEISKKFSAGVAAATTPRELVALRIHYLGRKNGVVTTLLRSLKDLPEDERRTQGPLVQELRTGIENALREKERHLQTTHAAAKVPFDLTLSGIPPVIGHRHPLSIMRAELLELFRSMGFMIFEGQELEHDFYNFEALNFPPEHPARDIQDTFFVRTPLPLRARQDKRKLDPKKWLMRTHTSNMQVRLMEEHTPPLRTVVAGRCFRNEATDARHEHTFYQLEGFVVDRDVSVRQLSWTLHEIFRQLFGATAKVRLRPGYFPFVEPGYEVDASCNFCEQRGCSICKGTGWLEMAGAGMIHPNVFAAAGHPEGKYTGFAFGLGFGRIAMLRYNIPDNRMFLESDIRFLEQF